MENLKQKLSSLAGKTSKEMKPAIKKSIMAAVTVAALTIGAGSSLAADSKLTTVYYVYLNDKFIGTVADKTEVENLVNAKMAAVEKEYKDLDLEMGLDVSYVPEQVFEPATNNSTSEVVEKLNNLMAVQAEASAIVIDGEPIAYVKDEKAAKEVMDRLFLEHVSADELAEWENKKKSSQSPIPEVKENETRLLDVYFSKKVTTSEERIEPKKILTVDEAVKLLKKGTLEEKKYQVKEGDVLGSIANSHNLRLSELLSLNKDLKEDAVLKLGQELNVTALEPFVEVVVERQSYIKEDVAFSREITLDSKKFKGDITKKQKGEKGIKGVVYVISEQNGKIVKKKAIKTEMLKEPVTEIVVKGTKVVPSRGDGNFVWPTNGGYISSKMGYRWSRMHKGIDIARPSNYTIKAADNGVVVSAGYDGGYGNKIVIDHKNGYRTVYAHLKSISVSKGQTVSAGSKIGIMGRTGDSTGTHLHFEMYLNGKLIDPLTKVNR